MSLNYFPVNSFFAKTSNITAKNGKFKFIAMVQRRQMTAQIKLSGSNLSNIFHILYQNNLTSVFTFCEEKNDLVKTTPCISDFFLISSM